MNYRDYTNRYIAELHRIADTIDLEQVAKLASKIQSLQRSNGRLFILGVGGSAANASHAVNDFRKILGIETYAPSDNVSELTARVNDDGWDTTYVAWLKGSRLRRGDGVLVFSVGGGSSNTSKNLVESMRHAKEVGAEVYAIVSRDGGYAKAAADCCVLVPVIANDTITPHAEEWQGIIWHLVVSCVKQAKERLNIKIYSDGAVLSEMQRMHSEGLVKGFTTNPTLMRKAGVTSYREWATSVLGTIQELPISFEVFSDEFEEMYKQAKTLSALGQNVYVKIPITNTRGESAVSLIKRLDAERIKLNVTAVFTPGQVQGVLDQISCLTPHVISVFAGRIADTGVDPIPVMGQCLRMLRAQRPNCELLWASPREVLNIYQANDVGCDIITATPDLISKLSFGGKNLEEFSRETVEMFYTDAAKSGFTL